jgi:hypothetical protein
MSKRNLQNIIASHEAKEAKKAEIKRREPMQKILNTKSPKCRQIVGSLLYQTPEIVAECKSAIEEIGI